jgi:transposase
VEEQRKNLVAAYLKGTATMSELCVEFGVSRKTAYKWCNRYNRLGEKGLRDLPKAPLRPTKLYHDEIIEMMIDLKLKKRGWGPRKIIAKLEREYPRMDWPSPTRLYEIFKENNLVTPK